MAIYRAASGSWGRMVGACVVALVMLPIPPAAGANKYAGEFLTHGVGARALGMGSAFVAVADDATAGYWNPAGVADVEGRSVQLMHSETFGDVVNYDTGAYAQPLGNGAAFAVTVIRLAIDDIPFTDFETDEDRIIYDPSRITWESDSESALLVTYARRSSDRMRVGGNLKVIRKSVGDHSCYGVGFDVGAKYDIRRDTTVGVNLQDVTTTFLSWNTGEREHIMPTAKIGAAYSRDVASMDGRFVIAADADFRFENRALADQYHVGPVSADTHYGIEFVYREMVGVRAGLAIGQLTAGAGLALGGFAVEYAFGRHEHLDSSHRVSATYGF
ncbi:MAG: PorV/PorQ family protein [Candidatus Eisenbacteria bacterium]|nr:PorV/PorQ family protein [Candidatus Eisenbacteria bacterium]